MQNLKVEDRFWWFMRAMPILWLGIYLKPLYGNPGNGKSLFIWCVLLPNNCVFIWFKSILFKMISFMSSLLQRVDHFLMGQLMLSQTSKAHWELLEKYLSFKGKVLSVGPKPTKLIEQNESLSKILHEDSYEASLASWIRWENKDDQIKWY